MSTREIIHQAFRRLDLPEADVHAIADALLEPPALATLQRDVQDIKRDVQDIKVNLGVMRWVLGILTAIVLGWMLGGMWMLLRLHERLGAIEATLRMFVDTALILLAFSNDSEPEEGRIRQNRRVIGMLETRRLKSLPTSAPPETCGASSRFRPISELEKTLIMRT